MAKSEGAFPEHVYLSTDFLGPSDGSIKLRKVKMVTARTSHYCSEGAMPQGDSHKIKPGDRYRLESALVDGDYWGKYKICVACMDKQLFEFGLKPNELYRTVPVT